MVLSPLYDEALAAFREAEEMQQERQPQYPLLYSKRGYGYCDLLPDEICRERPPWRSVDAESMPETERDRARSLQSDRAEPDDESPEQAIARIREVQNRAEWIMNRTTNDPNTPLLDQGLDHLTLGRTYLLEGRLSQETSAERQETEEAPVLDTWLSALGHAEEHLNESVALLRQGGQQEIRKAEKPYEPHVPDRSEWKPPKYVGVFKKGRHRRLPPPQRRNQSPAARN